MFIKKTRSKNFTYLSIVETYRDNGRVRHKTIVKLGRLDLLQKNGSLARLGESFQNLTPQFRIPKIKELARLNWGAELIYRRIWKNFDLDTILDQSFTNSKIEFDYKETVFLEIISRLMRPCSKLQVYLNQRQFHGINEIPLQHIYRVLDYLSDFQKSIEDMIFEKHVQKFGMEINVVLYDVTTLYFEGAVPDKLRDYGFSKDAKFGEVQVVVGMLVDLYGRPISCGIFPGNTFESKTLEAALESVRTRFQIKQVVIVADRGINSKLNLKQIKDHSHDYVVGCRLKSLSKNIQKKALDLNSYETFHEKDGTILKYLEMEYDNVIKIEKDGKKTTEILKEKIACTWSSKRAEKDRKDRERLILKAQKLLDNGVPLESKKGAKRYLKAKTEQKGTKDLALDSEKIKEDAKWDGFYAVQVSKKEMVREDILNAYHSLWKIEESFRIMKHSLEIRPIYLSTPERVIGHIVLCFLAFVLHRNLELELMKEGLEHSVERIRDAINGLEASILEVGGIKCAVHSPIDGLAKEILRILKVRVPKEAELCSSFEM